MNYLTETTLSKDELPEPSRCPRDIRTQFSAPRSTPVE